MQSKFIASEDLVRSYWELFVNRLAYVVQSPSAHPKSGRYYYYRPTIKDKPVSLSLETIRRHLEARQTIGLYAINPKTQRCRWVAIDADYENALEDLLKLQWELREDGVEAGLEKSRRGGHLWIFAEKPLLAKDCRIYIYNLASRLKVPVKGTGLADGIEVFPKQDMVSEGEFGNAIRGPLGFHQAAKKRFWYYGADYDLDKQMAYLLRLKRITEEEMARIVSGMTMPEQFVAKPKIKPQRYRSSLNGNHREFRILDYIRSRLRKVGRDYRTRCPSCAQLGRDRAGDDLAILISDPRKYRCWAGCKKEEIRAALGCPIRNRGRFGL